jgi:hypothetical protein
MAMERRKFVVGLGGAVAWSLIARADPEDERPQEGDVLVAVDGTGLVPRQAPPIVNNGVMFVATPGNQLLTIDAKTGGVLWRYKRPIPEDMTLLHPTSRGVGLYGEKVFFSGSRSRSSGARREDR